MKCVEKINGHITSGVLANNCGVEETYLTCLSTEQLQMGYNVKRLNLNYVLQIYGVNIEVKAIITLLLLEKLN
jgi:hypothetical protein